MVTQALPRPRSRSAWETMMIARAMLLACALACASVPAKNFRWSSQGDANSLDPHALNESFTNALTGLAYESLARYDKNMVFVPALAISWSATSPTTWEFNLRRDVKFQDGTPFTADDVVFSFERAKDPTSGFVTFANQMGVVRKIDDYTVEFRTEPPNPILPVVANTVIIMSKAWCEKNNSVRPQDFRNKVETFASRNAMGTGPYRVVSFQPGVKIAYAK